jgi:hypothetical protein
MIERSGRLRQLVQANRGNHRYVIQSIYLTILSRYPTETELAAVEDYLKTGGGNLQGAAGDLAWALINTKEFLYRH